jgi:hypothetical protein
VVFATSAFPRARAHAPHPRRTTTFGSTDVRSTLPRFTPEARKANRAVIDLLGRIAARKNASLTLTPGDLREIERAASQITVEGDRDPEAVEQLTGR